MNNFISKNVELFLYMVLSKFVKPTNEISSPHCIVLEAEISEIATVSENQNYLHGSIFFVLLLITGKHALQ